MYYNDYGYVAAEEATSILGTILASLGVMILISLALSIFFIVCMWKLFKKAGKNGWEAIIPIYNIIVLIEVAGLPLWYIALIFIPFANIYAAFKIFIELAHKFGESTGFGVGMSFLPYIFIPILALGKATYQGSMENNNSVNMNQNVNYGYGNPVFPAQGQYNTQGMNQVPQQQPVQTQSDYFNNQMPEQPHMNTMNQNNYINNEASEQLNNQVINVVPPVSSEQTQPQNVYFNATDIPQPNNEQVKFCPNCGNKTAMSADTCFMCGYKFQ